MSEHADAVEVAAQVSVDWPDGRVDDRLWFRLPAGTRVSPEAAADACFALGLLLAMAAGTDLRLAAPVSPRLLAQSAELQDILTCWHPRKLTRARLDVTARSTPGPAAAPGTISFFTGGVDSYFTAVAEPERVTALAFVHGYDIPLHDTAFFAETLGHLEAAATELGKPLVHLATNLKQFTAGRIYWGPIAHGPALLAAGMLLHQHGGTLLVPSSRVYTELGPWGTHPLTDRLYSTEYLTFAHDGAATSRLDKTLHLAANDSARRHLRVCWKKTGAYNCGLCEKCLRTMTTLKLAGALDAFDVFPATFSTERIRTQELDRDRFALQNLRLAREVGDAELAAALKDAIRSYRERQAAPKPSQAPAVTRHAAPAGPRQAAGALRHLTVLRGRAGLRRLRRFLAG